MGGVTNDPITKKYNSNDMLWFAGNGLFTSWIQFINKREYKEEFIHIKLPPFAINLVK